MKVSAVIPAAGLGKRLGIGSPKALIRIAKIPLFLRTLKNIARSYAFTDIVLACPPGYQREVEKMARAVVKRVKVVEGAETRALSVKNAVLATDEKTDWVLIHDCARPFVSPKSVREVIRAANKTGVAILAAPITATVKRVKPGQRWVQKTEDRSSLFGAQTPQVFKKKLLLQRYAALKNKVSQFTDEAALFDGTSTKVQIVEGEPSNIKVTTPFDLAVAEVLLKKGLQ